jgi:hypothetical protein
MMGAINGVKLKLVGLAVGVLLLLLMYVWKHVEMDMTIIHILATMET